MKKRFQIPLTLLVGICLLIVINLFASGYDYLKKLLFSSAETIYFYPYESYLIDLVGKFSLIILIPIATLVIIRLRKIWVKQTTKTEEAQAKQRQLMTPNLLKKNKKHTLFWWILTAVVCVVFSAVWGFPNYVQVTKEGVMIQPSLMSMNQYQWTDIKKIEVSYRTEDNSDRFYPVYKVIFNNGELIDIGKFTLNEKGFFHFFDYAGKDLLYIHSQIQKLGSDVSFQVEKCLSKEVETKLRKKFEDPIIAKRLIQLYSKCT